jgi:hypothetical protein
MESVDMGFDRAVGWRLLPGTLAYDDVKCNVMYGEDGILRFVHAAVERSWVKRKQ